MEQNKALWQIEQDYLELNNMLIDNGGEITDEINERLNINKNELQEKANAYAYVIKKNESECEAIDKEIERLNAHKKSRSNASERLKATIKNAMLIYDHDKIETSLMKISLLKSKSVTINNEDLLPDKFLKTKVTTTTTPDKIAIKKAIEEGEEVDGAFITVNHSVQIK